MLKVYEIWVREVQSGRCWIKAESKEHARATFQNEGTGWNGIDWNDDTEVEIVEVKEAEHPEEHEE